ncbi:MAG: pyridoxamine kinase [Defluviitaleaceae bacterium]|nr:pyridoxamine kinase [Defluviitaleaceae bacterium]
MKTQKKVCAIHDISCVGRCSLTVALPILSAAGTECSVLPTAVLSTHTGGFTGFTYRDLTEDITPISTHWQTLGINFDAMYSGFLGSFEQLDLVAELFDTYRGDGIVMVDPVMADEGKLYPIYSPEMAQGMAKLCAKADIIIPNLTEAAFILGESAENWEGPHSEAYITGLLNKLAALGPKQVVLTGVTFEKDTIGAASLDAASGVVSYAFSKRAEGHFHGTGDTFGSALLSGLLNDMSLQDSMQLAVDYVCECIDLALATPRERRYGVPFEQALPMFMKRLGRM